MKAMRVCPSAARCRIIAARAAVVVDGDRRRRSTLAELSSTTGDRRAADRRASASARRPGDITISPSTRPRIACDAPPRISLAIAVRAGDEDVIAALRRAARSMPRMTSEKNSPCRSGSTTPMVCVERVRETARGGMRHVAQLLGDSRHAADVSSRTGPLRLKTRETVATETPAFAATSRMVTFGAIAARPLLGRGIRM